MDEKLKQFGRWLEVLRDDHSGPRDDRYVAGWEDAVGWVMDEFDERFLDG